MNSRNLRISGIKIISIASWAIAVFAILADQSGEVSPSNRIGFDYYKITCDSELEGECGVSIFDVLVGNTAGIQTIQETQLIDGSYVARDMIRLPHMLTPDGSEKLMF